MSHDTFGQRRFGRVNWLGLWTLAEREIIRFLKVYTQTLLAPIATAGLFLLVFTLARGDVAGIPFSMFLAPGLVMMTVIQQAFANTSSSILIAKVQGSIVDSLTPPLSSHELTLGFALGGAARGVLVAFLAALILFPLVGVGFYNLLWLAFFSTVGSIQLALVGLAAGIWSQKFDHVAAVTNFIVTPLSFLSGTFYLAAGLPEPWRSLVWWNPIFYLIDGFRFGALGISDSNPWFAAIVSVAVTLLAYAICWRMFATGYRLKS